MALWGGRFSQQAHHKFKSFNDSLAFDYRLAQQDVEGSYHWAQALVHVQVLTQEECNQLQQALLSLKQQVKDNPLLPLESDAEDIHSWVEQQLISMVGDLGKKLHTGRSRNDQVALDMKLWTKQQIKQIAKSLLSLQQQIVNFASNNQDAVVSGYTHLQHGQPVSFAHWALAYFEMFKRDYKRLINCLELLDSCPLGSGALAGTAYPIDREVLAQNLGFKCATNNSLDAVSDRDYLIEVLSVASISAVHLSRWAEDLIIYNTNEFAFVEMSDKVTSGSSLMPQKKNPDACELIRGKVGRIVGAQNALLMTIKALPLAYNKDMQEDKELTFNALDTWLNCLDMACLVLEGLKVNKAKCKNSALNGYSNATELADYFVAKGVPFRQAHHMVGEIVLFAIEQNKNLEDLSIAQFQNFFENTDCTVYQALSLESCLEKRNVKGGVNPSQVKESLQQAQQFIDSQL